MNLRNVTDAHLIRETEKLVAQEREVLTRLLHHLLEIDRRRLFSSYHCGSLHDYCTKHLKFSEDQTSRRIAAMRLLKDLPEIESKIEDGSFSMSTLGVAQTLIRSEEKIHAAPMNRSEKLEILQSLENKSVREAQKVAIERSSAPAELVPDRIKAISASKVKLEILAESVVEEKLKTIRGLVAHSHPNISFGELLDIICDMAIATLDPAQKKGRAGKDRRVGISEKYASCSQLAVGESSAASRRDQVPTPRTASMRQEESHGPATAIRRDESRSTSSTGGQRVSTERQGTGVQMQRFGTLRKRVHIKAEVRREVWRQNKSRCAQCGSRHALEIEHIQGWALGGSNDIENLSLLCRKCNQRAAISKLGQTKMQHYLDRQGVS